MEKFIYDNSNELWYELHGDFYLLCPVLSNTEACPIGIWDRELQQYLRDHRPMVCSQRQTFSYLTNIDTQARIKLDLLVMQLTEKEDINKQLKKQDQIAYVKAMNNIHNRAEEIINGELIYIK